MSWRKEVRRKKKVLFRRGVARELSFSCLSSLPTSVGWTLVLSLNQLFEVNLWDQPATSQRLVRGLWTRGKETKYPNTHKEERRTWSLLASGKWMGRTDWNGATGMKRERNGLSMVMGWRGLPFFFWVGDRFRSSLSSHKERGVFLVHVLVL